MSKQPDPSWISSYVSQSEQVNGTPGALTAAFRDLAALFASSGIDYAVFGAFAVAAYVPERRSTLDIDVVTREENLEEFRKLAPEYGFQEVPREDEGVRIVRFRHRNGTMLDLILDSIGAFADLRQARMVTIQGLGEVRVASALDAAYSKMRTQRRDWPRSAAKRAVDRSDLIMLLQSQPDLVAQLEERIEIKQPYLPPNEQNRYFEMERVLAEVTREAGLSPRGDRRALGLRRILLLFLTAVGFVLLVIGLIYLLSQLG